MLLWPSGHSVYDLQNIVYIWINKSFRFINTNQFYFYSINESNSSESSIFSFNSILFNVSNFFLSELL
jgi:hypothetical protein